MTRFLILSALFFSTCVSAQNPSGRSVRQPSHKRNALFLPFLNTPTDGRFGLQGNGTFGLGGRLNFRSVDMHFEDPDTARQVVHSVRFGPCEAIVGDGSPLSLGSCFPDEALGRMNNYRLDPGDGQPAVTGALYVPAPVQMTMPVYHIDGVGNEVRKGQLFRWKPDTGNRNNLMICVEYEPGNANQHLARQGDSSIVRNVISVKDNGKALMPASLFNRIPDGAVIQLYLIRASHKPVKAVGEQSILVYACHYMYGDFVYRD